FLLVRRDPPGSSLCPYTTLFRSVVVGGGRMAERGDEHPATVIGVVPGHRMVGAHARGVLAGPDAGRVVARLVHAQHGAQAFDQRDRKSTRLNSSHVKISYAVFCL